ncbi:MAG: TrkH family potassium uptake protein [Ruminococcus sp.]|nr:TrkH family potassium uptake protein [Ruminococcus sp.]MCM1381131.1 TrkH family potassium uptake protein [Muribaculaceae bacterium]MCM1479803.1 TrkH family potassium uptake protein [Muribaculaceae bacterium]
MNFKMIAYILGWILIFEAIFMAVPLVTAVCFGENEFWYFLLTAGFCLFAGWLMIRKKPERKELYSREGNVIVAFSWIWLSIFGALPFCISGVIPSYLDALFETVSGFTTTGASILSEVESLPKSMLMWRSFTHWVGGMGVLVFIMAFLPLSGAQNMHIMKAESPGPSVSKLVPRVKSTALLLYKIYFVLTFLEFIVLLICGMSVFEALNTAFATAGTGGFGVRNDSMGSFSPAVQIAVTVFMVLFSINFNSYFFLISGKIKEAFNAEVCAFLVIVAAVTGIITFNIKGLFSSTGEALRHSAFAVSSLISTTGFGTADFNLWPELSRTLLVLVMFIGACAGSTGGGMKVSRILILFKSMHKELLAIVHPKQVKKIKLNSHTIEHDVVRGVNVFMVAYLMTFIISLVLISFDNHDLITNFTAVAAAVNNIGPGLELVGPTENFGFFSAPAKVVLIFDMLAGRLELFPMLLLFTPSTWKK